MITDSTGGSAVDLADLASGSADLELGLADLALELADLDWALGLASWEALQQERCFPLDRALDTVMVEDMVEDMGILHTDIQAMDMGTVRLTIDD